MLLDSITSGRCYTALQSVWSRHIKQPVLRISFCTSPLEALTALAIHVGAVKHAATAFLCCGVQSCNILLAGDGTAKVADVGIARTLCTKTHFTMSEVRGTFDWCVPPPPCHRLTPILRTALHISVCCRHCPAPPCSSARRHKAPPWARLACLQSAGAGARTCLAACT